MAIKEYEELIAFHPGEYISDIIESYNINQEEFAKRLDSTPKTVSELVNGKINISEDLANKLSKLTGTSIDLWFNLQNEYDKKVLEIEEREKVEHEKLVSKKIDFSYFKIHGFCENKRYRIIEKIEKLRSLLKLSNLETLKEYNASVSYRAKEDITEINIINANVMLEIANNIARNQTDNKLNIKKLKSYLKEIKSMTTNTNSDFFERLKEILLECGIVLVALPHLKNAGLNGATTKFNNGSVMILLTDLNKKTDIFWFSLFHELGHIIERDFSSNLSSAKYLEKEKKADDFARDQLINRELMDSFLERGIINEVTIRELANVAKTHPGIVVGRLQKDEIIAWDQFNDLKVNYNFAYSL